VAYARTRIVSLPALALAIVDRQDPVPVGQQVTYQVILENEGTSADQDVRVQIQLPESLELVSATGDANVQIDGRSATTGPIGQLPPGEVYRWNIVARPVDEGNALVRAQVTSANLRQPARVTEPTTLFSTSAQQDDSRQ
jgi:uncharacterized repeat protein (TIGR01451 family)